MQPVRQLNEEALRSLLETLRTPEPSHKGYEEKFLADFYDRRASQMVQMPARLILWDHFKAYCKNCSAWNWAYSGLATATCAALVVIIWPSEQAQYTAPDLYVGTTVTPRLQPVSAESSPILLDRAPESLPYFKPTPQATKFPASLPSYSSDSQDFLSCPPVPRNEGCEFDFNEASTLNY